MNTVALVGRLVRDPEMRTTASGVSVASMRIAVDRAGDKNGDGYNAGFFNANAFGKTAEVAGQYLSKGRQVGISGRLKHHEWEAQDGTKRSSVEVDVFEITFVGSKSDGDSSATASYEESSGQASFTPPAQGGSDFQGSDDDIPF